jgi:Polyketide cyclase / dehydrase and lipid transport
MADEVTEQIEVAVPRAQAYAAVAEIKRMAKWSPECFAVWIWRREGGRPARFIGWNRRGPFIWFTTCRVDRARPGEEFAFEVTTFGQPVARWGYRFEEVPEGTRVTESWIDRRNRAAYVLGRIFTGKVTQVRPEANRAGMRETLRRLKNELEAAR